MQIRSQVASEFIDDLKEVSEENSLLLRESLVTSLSLTFDSLPVADKDASRAMPEANININMNMPDQNHNIS